MTSLASIITLLQLVLTLLANPATANNPSAQALASQVISLATQALSQPASTPLGTVPTSTITVNIPTSTDNSQPITLTVNPPAQPSPAPIGGPDFNSVVVPPVTPSCSFTVQQADSSYDPRTGNFSWQSDNVSNPTKGQFYAGNDIGIGGGQTQFKWIPVGNSINSLSGQTLIMSPSYFNLNHSQQFELVLGGATCTYTYTPAL